ncbi:MAG: DUF4290 domain-containing protein [Flavobacteriaceae bacterium]
METLSYNTQRPQLVIPEYGRHVHLMIEQVKSIPEREKRNNMAKAIIGVMGNLNPHLRDVPDFQHKLWDQLFIMSDFELDVDSPFEKPEKELLEAQPEPLVYPQSYPKYRFYGNNIKRMIDVALRWDVGEMRDGLVFTIANHMKKCFLHWNKDTVEDQVIFDHLDELSKGQLKVNPDLLPLTSSADFLKVRSKNGNGPTKSHGHHSRNRKRKRY